MVLKVLKGRDGVPCLTSISNIGEMRHISALPGTRAIVCLRRKRSNMIFVLNKHKEPLAPCHPAVARKLLKEGKAVIHKQFPFTIRLKEQKELDCQPEYRLKIDPGSRHTGLAILTKEKVVWTAQLHHRINIKSNMDDRRAHRRARKARTTRYRAARFDNRKRSDNWMPPSLQSRIQNIESWISRLLKLCPLTHISYENVKFDTQLMQNPEITGILYQQGELQGYEVREYLLEKWGRQCVCCGAKDIPLEVEHIIPRSRGGSNRVSNLTISCKDCNLKKGTQTAEEFGYPDIQKQAQKPMRDTALLNSIRWKIYEVLVKTGLPVECGTGARTKMNRIRMNLPKDHHFDAICVGESTPENIMFVTDQTLHIKAKGRGSHCPTNLDKYGFPRGYLSRQKSFFGFQTGDVVKATVPTGKYMGTIVGSVACRKTGRFDIKDKNGARIAQGINYIYCKIINRMDGYEYFNEKISSNGIPLMTKVTSILP